MVDNIVQVDFLPTNLLVLYMFYSSRRLSYFSFGGRLNRKKKKKFIKIALLLLRKKIVARELEFLFYF